MAWYAQGYEKGEATIKRRLPASVLAPIMASIEARGVVGDARYGTELNADEAFFILEWLDIAEADDCEVWYLDFMGVQCDFPETRVIVLTSPDGVELKVVTSFDGDDG